MRALLGCAVLATLWGMPLRSTAISIQFNYNMDLHGFFGTADEPTPARTTLEFIASAFQPLDDSLAPIVPGGPNNNWSAFFTHPSGGFQACACNISVPADTIVIYAGARDLKGSEVAQAGPGVWGVDNPGSAALAFQRAVGNRGQGSVLDDFAPWGGVLAFDTMMPDGAPRSWHYDPYSRPLFPDFDFASVAVHEIAHILGFGIAPTFAKHTINGSFTGPAAMSLAGGPVELDDDLAHWRADVASPPYAANPPAAALGPSLAAGQRKLLTPLDYAALADVGWQVPSSLLGLHGDADADADVDGADLLLWQRSYGLSGGPADINGDATIDAYDGWLIFENMGSFASSPTAGLQTPEPWTGALLALGFAIYLLIIRRPYRSAQLIRAGSSDESVR